MIPRGRRALRVADVLSAGRRDPLTGLPIATRRRSWRSWAVALLLVALLAAGAAALAVLLHGVQR